MPASSNDEPTLFHYTNAHGLMGIIKHREVWATESNYLNDPSEVSFASETLVSLLTARLDRGVGPEEQERAESAIALLQRAYVDPHSPHQYREDRAFITSFSRSDQSLTLWRLYGGRNGFSVGFDENRLQEWIGHDDFLRDSPEIGREEQERRAGLRANFQLNARIQDVSYGAEHVVPILNEIMALPYGDEAHEARLREVLKKLSGVKHEAYSDEKEARMIVQEQGHHAADPSTRVSASGALVAYRKIVFPFEAVRSITMAPGTNAPQTRRAIQSLLADGGRGPYSHVDLQECDIPFVW